MTFTHSNTLDTDANKTFGLRKTRAVITALLTGFLLFQPAIAGDKQAATPAHSETASTASGQAIPAAATHAFVNPFAVSTIKPPLPNLAQLAIEQAAATRIAEAEAAVAQAEGRAAQERAAASGAVADRMEAILAGKG